MSQISVKTLRYYDDEGILKAAFVDEVSRYRYYAPAQVEQARLLQNLRFAQVPLEDLREFMREPTREHQAQLFNRHIERLRAQVHELNSGIRSLTRRRDYPWHPQVYAVKGRVRPSVPLVFVHDRVGLGDLEDAREAARAELSEYLGQQGIEPTSPLMSYSLPDSARRGRPPDPRSLLDVYMGFELEAPLAGATRIQAGWTPGGLWYGTQHVGLYEYLGHTKAAVFQQAREDRVLVGDDPSAVLQHDFIHVEVFCVGPWECTDLSRLVTEVRWLLRLDTAGSFGAAFPNP
ncbi:MerR family transcriptional regulator [Deinococcus malanensis]|uniref:MerR family transcriptional regulator n=2 Tax=Deinococcus malanensis TaxID=1706855 RepID=A0ABQ2F1C6_9DEIO|nr:MerR family transcriptional regulator [Deinococcus malanensis]